MSTSNRLRPRSKSKAQNEPPSKASHSIRFPKLDDLSIGEGAARALTDIRRDMKTLRGSHWEVLRAEIARVYAIASFLRVDEDAWLDLCRHSDWEGFRNRPKRADREDALRHALRFAVGFSGKAATKRVSKFYNALQPFFRDAQHASEIPELVRKAGGFEALARANATPKKSGRKEPKILTIRAPLDERGRRLLKLPVSSAAGLKFRVEGIASTVVHATLLHLKKLKSA